MGGRANDNNEGDLIEFGNERSSPMREGQASRTALATANMRAAHQLFDPPPRILEDPFAMSIIGGAALQRIHDTADHYQSPQRRYFRSHVVLRSRFAEDRLAESMRRKVVQYVILGAGLDTFALRQPPWAKNLKIIEVDHPATQELKQSRLTAAGLEMPANAGFATINFEQESLNEGLVRYGFLNDRPTFFSFLGVIMYLTEEAIDALFQSASAFAKGSEIVLNYAPPPRDPSGPPSPLAERAASVGEPWLSYLDFETISRKLKNSGFSEVVRLSEAEAENRYFLNQPGNLPVPRRTHLITAVR
jgi:methyltransferase (TIGR00027 family)